MRSPFRSRTQHATYASPMGGGLLLVAVGAGVFLIGFHLPRRFEITVGRNRPGEVISLVVASVLVVAGLVALIR